MEISSGFDGHAVQHHALGNDKRRAGFERHAVCCSAAEHLQDGSGGDDDAVRDPAVTKREGSSFHNRVASGSAPGHNHDSFSDRRAARGSAGHDVKTISCGAERAGTDRPRLGNKSVAFGVINPGILADKCHMGAGFIIEFSDARRPQDIRCGPPAGDQQRPAGFDHNAVRRSAVCDRDRPSADVDGDPAVCD